MVRINVIKSFACGLLAAMLLVLTSGCQTTNSSPVYQPVDGNYSGPTGGTSNVATAPPLGATSDKFNVGDLVVVSFSGLSEPLPDHQERIKDDGTITLPFIGAMKATGKSSGELQRDIRTKYIESKIYPENLNVTVRGQERYFFVQGEVRNSNRFIWSEGMTVLKAITSAGNFTEFARRSKVSVTRLDGRKFTVNCDKAITNPELDLPVYPGDTVHVPRRFL